MKSNEQQEWQEDFDIQFPEIGHKHDENCEFVCHFRKDIKAFIAEQIEKAEMRGYNKGCDVSERLRLTAYAQGFKDGRKLTEDEQRIGNSGRKLYETGLRDGAEKMAAKVQKACMEQSLSSGNPSFMDFPLNLIVKIGGFLSEIESKDK